MSNQLASQVSWENLQETLKQAETDDDFEF